MVKMAEIRIFKGTIEFDGSKRVKVKTPQIYLVTLSFHVSHPNYDSKSGIVVHNHTFLAKILCDYKTNFVWL